MMLIQSVFVSFSPPENNRIDRRKWFQAEHRVFQVGRKSNVPRSSAHTVNMLEYTVFANGLQLGSIE